MSEKTFYDYNNINENTKKLCERNSFLYPNNIQKKVLEYLESNQKENVIITSEAGSGKTLCYLMLLLSILDPDIKQLQAIILLPTRELAYQTESYLTKASLQISHKKLIGGNADMKIPQGCQLVIGTLGKIKKCLEKKNKEFFKFFKILIVDEADKLVGQNDDNKYSKFLDFLKEEQQKSLKFCLVTASFDKSATLFYLKYMDKVNIIKNNQLTDEIKGQETAFEVLGQNNLLDTGISMSNSTLNEFYLIISKLTKKTFFEQKYEKLFEIIQLLKDKFKQCLIFYNHKGRGEQITEDFRSQGWPTAFIHGDMPQEQRVLIYDKIRNIDVKVILTTDLLSRGIDLKTVDLVINFDLPLLTKDYFHRVGRTGRYNSYGLSVSFFQENEKEVLSEILKSDKDHKLTELKENNQLLESFEKINEMNNYQEDVLMKLDVLKEKAKNVKEVECDLLNKKRKEKFEKHSLPGEWVDRDKEIYEEKEFKYYKKFCFYCDFIKFFEQQKE